jgi:CxxC-x17-CxxC domain-containing protein
VSVERQDKILTCKDCGDEFIFTIREQDFYSQKGFEHDPARCSSCRSARKRDRGNGAMNGNNAGYGNSMGGNYNGGLSGGYYNPAPRQPAGNRYANGGGNYGRSNNYGNQHSGGYNNGNHVGYGNNGGYNRGGGNYGNSGGGNYGNNFGGNRMNSGNYADQGQERRMYPITCANCGVQTEVPFAPRQGVPVFCRTCYNTQKGR